MIPLRTLAETRTPDGARLTLHQHGEDLFLKLDGRQLMSSTATASEILLSEIACDFHPPRPRPRILIGGLGLGFTLRRVLELVGSRATVHVAEYLPEVIAWNRELLGPDHTAMLEDERVSVFAADVFHIIARSTRQADRYDAILLDVDTGPIPMVSAPNQRLYDHRGIASVAAALNPGGRAAIWSADADQPFLDRLEKAGLRVQVFDAKAHERAKRAAHRIYLAEK